eukprot:4967755-Prymnesium_polylepis.1
MKAGVDFAQLCASDRIAAEFMANSLHEAGPVQELNMPPGLRRLCYGYLRSELHAAAAELSSELGFLSDALSLPPGGALSPQQRVLFFRRAVPYMASTFAFCCRTAIEWKLTGSEVKTVPEHPEPLS